MKIDFNPSSTEVLGSLFKLTEVFTRDDNCPSNNRLPIHIRFKYDDDDDEDDSRDGTLVEDVGLTGEMSALGLPISFKTSKLKRGGQNKVKSKAARLESRLLHKRADDQVRKSCEVSEERSSPSGFRDKLSNSSSLSLPDLSEHSCSRSDVTDDILRLSNYSERVKPAAVAAELVSNCFEELVYNGVDRKMSGEALNDDFMGVDLQLETEMMSVCYSSNSSVANTCSRSNMLDDHIDDHHKDMDVSLLEQVDTLDSNLDSSIMQPVDLGFALTSEQAQVSDMPEDSQSTMVLSQVYSDNVISSGTCDDWSACWDSFYKRCYFYNSKTRESTWYPPAGMESFAYLKMPEDDVGVSLDRSEEVQLDEYEQVDIAGPDDVTKRRIGGELSATALSSASLTLSDSASMLNSSDSRVLDHHCQDEITLEPSLNMIKHSHILENESRQEDSGDMCNGHLRSEDFDLVGTTCENTGKNCDHNIRAQMTNASSSTFVFEAADDDFVNLVHLEEEETKEEEETIAINLQMQATPALTKQRRMRRCRRRKNSFNDSEGTEFKQVEENIDLTKYWCQRYLLFSRFDDGIEMDEEGWFSVTPEAIAKHHASRSGGGIVIDCFTGVGGNAIQFAKTSKHVIAIDIDPKKIEYAQHNAAIYGVGDRIEFIVGDSLSLASKFKADVVFLSPPWGGPDYVKVDSYELSMLQPYDGQSLFNTFKEIAPTIIMFLPRQVNIDQLAELSLLENPPWSLEVEKNFLNGKVKAVTAYFSRTSI